MAVAAKLRSSEEQRTLLQKAFSLKRAAQSLFGGKAAVGAIAGGALLFRGPSEPLATRGDTPTQPIDT